MQRGRRDWVWAARFLLLHSFLPAYLSDDTSNVCCGLQQLKMSEKTLLKLETSKVVLESCCPARCPGPVVVLRLNLWQQRQTGTTGGRRDDKSCIPDWRVRGTHESSEAQKHHHMPQFRARRCSNSGIIGTESRTAVWAGHIFFIFPFSLVSNSRSALSRFESSSWLFLPSQTSLKLLISHGSTVFVSIISGNT